MDNKQGVPSPAPETAYGQQPPVYHHHDPNSPAPQQQQPGQPIYQQQQQPYPQQSPPPGQQQAYYPPQQHPQQIQQQPYPMQQPMEHEKHAPYPQQQQQQGHPPMPHQQSGGQQFQTVSPIASLNRGPMPVDCPACGQRGLTNVEYQTGNSTHGWALLLCCVACLGCIPYLINSLKDVQHKCGKCGVLLATWHRSGSTEVHLHG